MLNACIFTTLPLFLPRGGFLQVDGSSISPYCAEAVLAAPQTLVEGGSWLYGRGVCSSSSRRHH